jgi:FAD binding domain
MSNPNEIVDIFRTVTERTDLYGDMIWFSEFRPTARMVHKSGEGRVFVIGGSYLFHLFSVDSSVQMPRTYTADAFNLSWKVALVLKNHVLPPKSSSLLDSYMSEGLPVIAEMLSQTTATPQPNASSKDG